LGSHSKYKLRRIAKFILANLNTREIFINSVDQIFFKIRKSEKMGD
jgi:hypothetical protein